MFNYIYIFIIIIFNILINNTKLMLWFSLFLLSVFCLSILCPCRPFGLSASWQSVFCPVGLLGAGLTSQNFLPHTKRLKITSINC